MSSWSHNLERADVRALSERLEQLADTSADGLEVRASESLSRHCSMRVGGEAAFWVEVGTQQLLKAVLEAGHQAGMPMHVVGLGSNTLFPDDGIDGLVIRLVGGFDGWEVVQDAVERPESTLPATDGAGLARVRVGAGTVNAHLVRGLLDEGWTGLEFLNLVPGTFGGAVALNAGTKEAELSERLASVTWCRRRTDGWAFERVAADHLSMSYRYADIPSDAVVVSGEVLVETGDVEAAREAMQQDRARRDETQPYKLASWGSTFANPPDDYAGRLIDEVGLKGRQIGDARISEDHANFFINQGDATADDLLRLMALARRRVRESYGVDLRPEVRFVGFDGMSELERLESGLGDGEERSDVSSGEDSPTRSRPARSH